MRFTNQYIEQIRQEIQAADLVLDEAQARQEVVLTAASSFPGSLRTFRSGSLAHLTVIHPVSDADCGLVLDRRAFPDLGPEGQGVGPADLVAAVRDHIGPLIREDYPSAQPELTKRAIKLSFNAPVSAEEDPTVDLVVCLTRASGDGLWIPHLKRNMWDASHPEKHTELFSCGPEDLRRIRRRAIRLAKAHNKQYREPAISSFNIEALALEAITKSVGIVDALHTLFDYGARSLAAGPTEDPARVSGPIRILNPEEAVKRLRAAADGMAEAIAHDNDECAVRAALSTVFFDFIEPCEEDSKERFASRIRSGAVVVGIGSSTRPVRPVRSHGADG